MKNHILPHGHSININNYRIIRYSDPTQPEVSKLVDTRHKRVYINLCGNCDGVVQVVDD